MEAHDKQVNRHQITPQIQPFLFLSRRIADLTDCWEREL